MKYIIFLLIILIPSLAEAQALSKSALTTQNNNTITTNGAGKITGQVVNSMNNSMISSFCGLNTASDCILPPDVAINNISSGTITNGMLANPNMSINGVVCSLGSSCSLSSSPGDWTVNGNTQISGIANIGTGSFAPLTHTNTPNLTGSSSVFPAADDNSNIPAFSIARTTQGGNPSNQSNETLFVGTHLNLTSPSSFYWGIYNAVQIDHNAAPNGNGAYAEAMRSDCSVADTIDQVSYCWGMTARSTSHSNTIQGFNIGVEGGVTRNLTNAPIPPYFNNIGINASFVASGSENSFSNLVNDAGFMVNNFTISGGFQAGVSCPSESTTTTHTGSISGTTLTLSAPASDVYQNYNVFGSGVTARTKIVSGSGTTYVVDTSQTVGSETLTFAYENIKYACLYAASHSEFGIDLSHGNWVSDQINGVNWSVDPTGQLSIYPSSGTMGIELAYGTFSVAQIHGTNFDVTPSGGIYTQQYNTETNLPTISPCGTSPPAATAGSSTNAGQFTFGGGAPSSCTVTFATAFGSTSFCTVTPASSISSPLTYYISSENQYGFTVTLSSGTSSLKFNYTCMGN